MAVKSSAGTIMKQHRSGTLHLAAEQGEEPGEASVPKGIRVLEQQAQVARRVQVHCAQPLSTAQRQNTLAVTAQGAAAAPHAGRHFKGKASYVSEPTLTTHSPLSGTSPRTAPVGSILSNRIGAGVN